MRSSHTPPTPSPELPKPMVEWDLNSHLSDHLPARQVCSPYTDPPITQIIAFAGSSHLRQIWLGVQHKLFGLWFDLNSLPMLLNTNLDPCFSANMEALCPSSTCVSTDTHSIAAQCGQESYRGPPFPAPQH